MTIVLGIVLLATVAYLEGWVAEPPLALFDIFQVPCLKALFVSLFFSYGVLGTFNLWHTIYAEYYWGIPVEVVA